MQPPSLLSSFFSSIKQVEKRLKLEHQSVPSNSSSQPIPETYRNYTSTESLSTPIYLHLDQTKSNINSKENSNPESEPPQAFVSLSPEFPPTQPNPPHTNPTTTHHRESNDFDDVQMLMQLLGLSYPFQEENNEEEEWVGLGSCKCAGGFYERIVGVKGPKCEKEVERMEGWIKYILGSCNGEEPLRLAYLLLGKAAFALDGDDCGFGGLEFPSAIDEFLKNEPPKE